MLMTAAENGHQIQLGLPFRMASSNKLDLSSIEHDKPLQRIFHHLNRKNDQNDLLYNLLHGISQFNMHHSSEGARSQSQQNRSSLDGDHPKDNSGTPVVIY